MEHTKHIWRAGLLLVAFVVVFIIFRHLMIPESFGIAGFYRYDSLQEFMDIPVIHGDAKSCLECHDPSSPVDAYKRGKHATISCETCHAPLSHHVDGGEKVADMRADRSVQLCLYCHQELRARPQTFPQVKLKAHLAEMGAIEPSESIPESVCLTCHEAHDPSP